MYAWIHASQTITKITCMLASPLYYLGQFLRVIWQAVSQAIILSNPPNKVKVHSSCCEWYVFSSQQEQIQMVTKLENLLKFSSSRNLKIKKTILHFWYQNWQYLKDQDLFYYRNQWNSHLNISDWNMNGSSHFFS